MKNDESPFDSASLWSRLTFGFLNEIFESGKKRTLQYNDIPNLPKHCRSEIVSREFEKYVKYYQAKPQYKYEFWLTRKTEFCRFWFLWAIWCVIWPDTKWVLFPWLLKEIALLSTPVFIGKSMQSLQSTDPDWTYWIFYMFGLMISKILQCVLRRYHHTYSQTIHTKVSFVIMRLT